MGLDLLLPTPYQVGVVLLCTLSCFPLQCVAFLQSVLALSDAEIVAFVESMFSFEGSAQGDLQRQRQSKQRSIHPLAGAGT